MKSIHMVAVGILGLVSGAALWFSHLPVAVAQEKKPEANNNLPPLTVFMRAKLAASEQVLDGIVNEDFDKISKGTLRLQVISAAEKWKVRDDQNYTDHSADFRRILSRLKADAQKKNLEGAALSYVEMTMSCIKCHKDLRKAASPVPEKKD